MRKNPSVRHLMANLIPFSLCRNRYENANETAGVTKFYPTTIKKALTGEEEILSLMYVVAAH